MLNRHTHPVPTDRVDRASRPRGIVTCDRRSFPNSVKGVCVAEFLLPDPIYRESQFQGALTGACGPNALSMGVSWATQVYHSTLQIFERLRAAGLCDANGITTIDTLFAGARLHSLTIPEFRGYGEPWEEWRAFLCRHAGRSFICLNVAAGRALVDLLTGSGENAADLGRHLLGVVGRHEGGSSPQAGRDLPAGWWAVDGANWSAATLVYYLDVVMAAAQPCGAFAIAGPSNLPMPVGLGVRRH